MKAMFLTLCLATFALAATPPKAAGRARAVPAGCPAATELFQRYTAVELLPDQFSLFAPHAVVRLYGESADGQDLGHKDLSLEEYRVFGGDLERFRGRGPVNRYRRVRCELNGGNWLVTAERVAIHKHYEAPVSFVIGLQDGRLRILSASFVQIVD